jgi:hypothetical protein
LVLVITLVACGGSPAPEPGGADAGVQSDASAPGGADASLDETWTWYEDPDSRCADESPTGLGLNPSSNSKHLLIFLEGGGICYSDAHCTVLNRDFGADKFAAFAGGYGTMGIFDRSDAGNPFRDHSFAFVPYCTGDAHAGDSTVTYNAGTFHHAGYPNYGRFLARIAATFPDADSVVLAGSSAGGLGASWNYVRTHEAFAPTPVFLIDDSGPWFRSPPFPADLLAERAVSWRLDTTAPDGCAECATLDGLGLAQVVPYAASQFPDFRGALIASTEDAVISVLAGVPVATVTTSLYDLQTAWESDRFKVFYMTGTQHGFLVNGTLSSYVTNGLTLSDFLAKGLSSDPSWMSAAPP